MSVQQLKAARVGLGAVSMMVALAVCTPTASAETVVPVAPAQAGAAETAHGVGGRVTAREGVIVRAKATSASRKLGSYRGGAVVRLSCKVRGQNVLGNSIWYKLWNRSGWVTARYVDNFSYVSWCGPNRSTDPVEAGETRRDRVEAPTQMRESMQGQAPDQAMTPEQERMQSADQERMQAPDQERMQSADQERMQSPDQERMQTQDQERMQSADQERMQTQDQERMQAPEQERMQAPDQAQR